MQTCFCFKVEQGQAACVPNWLQGSSDSILTFRSQGFCKREHGVSVDRLNNIILYKQSFDCLKSSQAQKQELVRYIHKQKKTTATFLDPFHLDRLQMKHSAMFKRSTLQELSLVQHTRTKVCCHQTEPQGNCIFWQFI